MNDQEIAGGIVVDCFIANLVVERFQFATQAYWMTIPTQVIYEDADIALMTCATHGHPGNTWGLPDRIEGMRAFHLSLTPRRSWEGNIVFYDK